MDKIKYAGKNYIFIGKSIGIACISSSEAIQEEYQLETRKKAHNTKTPYDPNS